MNDGRIDQEFDRMVRNGSNAKRGMLNCRLSNSVGTKCTFSTRFLPSRLINLTRRLLSVTRRALEFVLWLDSNVILASSGLIVVCD